MTTLKYDIIRSNRKKTATIDVVDGVVRVRVPNELSQDRINELITKKLSWIKKRISEQSSVQTTYNRELISGSPISYLGKRYKLKRSVDHSKDISMQAGYIVAKIDKNLSECDTEALIRRNLVDWYTDKARIYLNRRSKYWASKMGVSYSSISIKNYRSKWGDCNSIKGISYNWRIMLAPQSVIDYVVVHELCHLTHMNHSKEFWALVTKYCPNWKEKRLWLKEHSRALDV